MKKVVPFKKDIVFDTNVGEINSISLEHFIEKEENNSVKGYFLINGDYRITEASVNLDPFEYKLPFDINIDEKYDVTDMVLDIDNFYYEVINNKILSVNIDLAANNIEEKIILEEPIRKENEIMEENIEMEERCVEEESNNVFNNHIETEYKTYKVYLVRENDTLDSILENAGVTKEKLALYNDLNNIKLGDKLIIPSA